jgi:hypothetical protein
VDKRIHTDRLPKDVQYPAITFFTLAEPRTYSQSGDSSLTKPVISFSIWSKTKASGLEVVQALIAALSGWKGMADTTEVYASFFEARTELFDEEAKLYHFPIDFKFHYNG